MAYTQSVLQTELSKHNGPPTGWPWRLMALSFVVLLTVIAVYAGMQFGFEDAYLRQRLQKADAESASIFKTVSPDDQRQIFDFYSQISNINTLLNKQGKGTYYFDLIEKNTIKQIVYTAMDMKIDDKSATIKFDGKTPAYGTIVQQMELYKNLPAIKEVKLSGARVAGQAADGILFSIQLTFNR